MRHDIVKNTSAAVINPILFGLIVLLSAALVFFAWIHFYRAAYPIEYSEIVGRQSVSTNVPEALLLAVIRTESGFDPDARSSAEARGLMQITQATFEWAKYRIKEESSLSFDNLYDSETNIRYGSEILRLLLDEFKSENNALCAYHAGWGNVKKWLKNPEYTVNGEIVSIPISETRHYVSKVLKTKNIYEKLYGSGKD